MFPSLFNGRGHRGVVPDILHVFRDLNRHAWVSVAAVDPVEAGDGDPVLAEEPLQAVLRSHEVGLPADAFQAGVFVPAQILLRAVLRRGGRIPAGDRPMPRGRGHERRRCVSETAG